MAQTLSREEFTRIYGSRTPLNLNRLSFKPITVTKRDGTSKVVHRTAPQAIQAAYVSKAFDSKLVDSDGVLLQERLVGLMGVNAERMQSAETQELMKTAKETGDYQPVANAIGLTARCGSNRTAYSLLNSLQAGTEILVTFEKITDERGTLIVCDVASIPPPAQLTDVADKSVNLMDMLSMIDDTVKATPAKGAKAPAGAKAKA
jgi:hypothetical protein